MARNVFVPLTTLALGACAPEYAEPVDLGDAARADGEQQAEDEDPSFADAHGPMRGGVALVAIPAGTWETGLSLSDPDYDLAHTPHDVTLSHDYWIGETEVTVTQWLEYSDYHPTEVQWGDFQAEQELAVCSDCPVHSVSWDEILAFANAVSRAHGLEECFACEGDGPDVQCAIAVDPYQCEGYRMATEAEWERAAWGGESYRYPGSDDIDEIGFYEENSEMRPHPVASKMPNGYGLFDMGGNIREFVLDWFADYPAGSVTDPFVGPEAGTQAVERGGSWACRVPELRPNRRNLTWDYERDIHSGFRLARTVHADEDVSF